MLASRVQLTVEAELTPASAPFILALPALLRAGVPVTLYLVGYVKCPLRESGPALGVHHVVTLSP